MRNPRPSGEDDRVVALAAGAEAVGAELGTAHGSEHLLGEDRPGLLGGGDVKVGVVVDPAVVPGFGPDEMDRRGDHREHGDHRAQETEEVSGSHRALLCLAERWSRRGLCC